jgi:hypothetical protein
VNIVDTKLKSIASKKANAGMKAAIDDAAATRLASTVTMSTGSDLKACVNEEIIKQTSTIRRSVHFGVKSVIGDSSTKLASAITGKMHSVMKSLVDEIGFMLTSIRCY